MVYPGFDAFSASARPTAELWRTLLGALLILVVYSVGAAAIIAGGTWIFTQAGIGTPRQVLEGSTPAALLLVLFHFVAMVAAAMLVTRFLHRRPSTSLLGDRDRLWSDFARVALIAAVVGAMGAGAVTLFVDIEWKLPLGQWILLLPLALVLILIQTGAEELVFRGYLIQQLGARFGAGARAAWMILPSLLFAVAHTDLTNQAGNWWAIIALTFVFALVAADMTARTGSLGAAWGLHFVNNCQAILVFSLAGPLSGLSLGSIGIAASSPSALPLIAIDAVALGAIYLIWRRLHG